MHVTHSLDKGDFIYYVFVDSYNAMAFVDRQQNANFTRLSRLLVDKGTEALRNTFDGIHPPASLPGVLNFNKSSLLKLKPRVINNSQWDFLYPPSGNLGCRSISQHLWISENRMECTAVGHRSVTAGKYRKNQIV